MAKVIEDINSWIAVLSKHKYNYNPSNHNTSGGVATNPDGNKVAIADNKWSHYKGRITHKDGQGHQELDQHLTNFHKA